MTGGRAGLDLVSGPVAVTLLRFALPTLVSSLLQSANASINAIWIGRLLGPSALAATTNASLVLFLLLAIVFGFGMATTVLIGQAIGRRDVDLARRLFGSAAGLFLLLSLATAAAGWAGAPAILDLLATPPDVRPLALDYLRLLFLALPPMFLSVLLTMALRGAGDAVTPMRFLALTVLLDILLNPLLILGAGPLPALGIVGSALATLIATGIGLAGLIAALYRRDLPLRLRGAEFGYLRPAPALLGPILGKGVPMGLQMLVVSGSALALVGLVNRYGVATTAAYGAANQLWTYVQMPALAVGAAVSAMAAQNIGAGRWDRVQRIAGAGIAINCAMTGLLVAAVMLLARPLLGLFLGDAEPALGLSVRMNWLVAWSWIPFGVSIVLTATVRANGAVMVPLAILFAALVPVKLGFALGFAGPLGADALWWSFPVASVTSLLLSALYFWRGGWRGRALADSVAAPAAAAPAAVAAQPGG
jgi:putative MATE family efflux protein